LRGKKKYQFAAVADPGLGDERMHSPPACSNIFASENTAIIERYGIGSYFFAEKSKKQSKTTTAIQVFFFKY